MRLAAKGLFLISVPLIFQIVVVVCLSLLLWQLQEQTNKEAKYKEIVAECNNLTLKLGEVVKSIFTPGRDLYSLTLDAKDVASVRSSVKDLQDRLAEDPAQAPNIVKLNQFADRFIDQLVKQKKSPVAVDGAGMLTERNIFEFRLMRTCEQLSRLLTKIVDIETSSHPPQEQQDVESRHLIRLFLLLAVLLSVLVTVCLAYFGSITIRKPLERMVINAAKISRREPLLPELPGKDELGNLDHVLHAVDLAIEEALTSERNLISNAADLVCSFDEHGLFRSANPFALQLLGYEPEELVAASVLSFTLSEDCDKVEQFLSSAHPDGETQAISIRMLRKDKHIIETSWSAIWSERERSFFCVVHDTTERKHIERLKQDFIAMISHDLRTPLMSVLSSINLVQSGATGGITPEVENDLNNAERSVEHLIELVNDLLDFEKLEAGRMEFDIAAIQLGSVFAESERLVEALVTTRKVTIQTPDLDQSAAGDQRKLVQVLTNLLSNALKHSPENGVVMIQTRLLDNWVEISVHDQGPGVPDEFAEKIFAPFEQISHRATAALGTGLGLAICKLVIEGHGGKIGVRPSESLEGSAFWFTVPLTDLENLEGS